MTFETDIQKYFGKIGSREEAVKVIREAAYICFFVAAIRIGALFLFGRDATGQAAVYYADASVYVVLGLLLFFLKSRVAAVLLLVVSVVVVGLTLANLAGVGFGGGNNVVVAALVAYAAFRAVQGTVSLNRRVASSTE